MIDPDEWNELQHEAKVLKRARRRYRCSDGFCGAMDCTRCRPFNWRRDEPEENEEEESED